MSASKVNQLQLLQQNIQGINTQRQQLENQLLELESALSELDTAAKAYKIVGKIMIASPKEELFKELQQKKEVTEIRLKNFSSQEKNLKENFEKLQKEVMEELQKKDDRRNN